LEPLADALQVGELKATDASKVSVDPEGARYLATSRIRYPDILDRNEIKLISPEGSYGEDIVRCDLISEPQFVRDVDLGIEVRIAQIGEE